MIQEKDIVWEKGTHWAMTNAYYSMYHDDKLGVEKQVRVQRINGGHDVGNSKTTYYISGIRKTYKTIDDLLTALNNRNQQPIKQINQ